MRRSWKVHTISRCWNAGNTSWKDLFLGRLRMNCCVGNEDVYLRVLDKRINRWYRIHRPLVRLEHFSPRHKYFSSKYNSHSNEFFIAHQSLYWKKESTAYSTPHFLEDNEILLTWFLFITGITRGTLWSCKFINHSLKHEVVIFAEILKH